MLHHVRCAGMHVQAILCSHSLPGAVTVSNFLKPTLQNRCYLLVLQALGLSVVAFALDRFDPFMFASQFLWDG